MPWHDRRTGAKRPRSREIERSRHGENRKQDDRQREAGEQRQPKSQRNGMGDAPFVRIRHCRPARRRAAGLCNARMVARARHGGDKAHNADAPLERAAKKWKPVFRAKRALTLDSRSACRRLSDSTQTPADLAPVNPPVRRSRIAGRAAPSRRAPCRRRPPCRAWSRRRASTCRRGTQTRWPARCARSPNPA